MVQRFDLANVGCAERIWRQAEELARRGHEVTLVHLPHPERRQTHPPLRPDFPEGVRPLVLNRRAVAFSRNARILANEIQKAELVHVWKAYPDILLPVLFGLRKNPRPLHYDWDDLEGGSEGIAERLTGSRLVGKLVAFWEREILRWADTVTAASKEIEILCLEGGFPADRIFPGPVGASLGEVDPACLEKWRERLAGRRAVVFVGQMEVADFPPEILGAVAEVARERPDLLLVMVGDGAGRAALEAKANAAGLSKAALFTGYVAHEEVQAILSLASCFLFPLRDDRMSRCKSPLVIVEAMAHGLPVIASEVGEAPRLLGDTGVLVPTLARESWAEAIRRLLSDAEREQRLGKESQKRFHAEWTWARAVDRLEEAYQRAINVGR